MRGSDLGRRVAARYAKEELKSTAFQRIRDDELDAFRRVGFRTLIRAALGEIRAPSGSAGNTLP